MKRFLLLCMLFLTFGGVAIAEEPVPPQTVTRTASYTEDGSEGCLRCHSGEKMRAVANSSHGNMENLFTPLASQGCEACHGPGSIHESRAHGGAGFPKLINFGRGKNFSPRDQQIEACLACHEDADGGTHVIEWHSSSHNRKSMNCSTCHIVHQEMNPMRDMEMQVNKCNRCHKKDIAAHEHFEEKNIDFDSLSCGTCHNVHEKFDRENRAEVLGD